MIQRLSVVGPVILLVLFVSQLPFSMAASKQNAIVGTIMVVLITEENVWNSTHDTFRAVIVLTGASEPFIIVFFGDMDFSRWVNIV
jgi:Na+/H+ antiporter NhaC